MHVYIHNIIHVLILFATIALFIFRLQKDECWVVGGEKRKEKHTNDCDVEIEDGGKNRLTLKQK